MRSWVVCISFFTFWILFRTFSLAQSLVSLGDSELVYAPYANVGQSDRINVIPDFSRAGYAGGGVKIPFVRTVITLRPRSGDCTGLIQDAIDALASRPLDASGFRGAVLLKKGVYRLDGEIAIKADGIVLRGEGDGVDGTVLVATKKKKHNSITLAGKAGKDLLVTSSIRRITSEFVPTGARDFTVEYDHDFEVGDSVIIEKTPSDKWITDLGMAQYGWSAKDYTMRYERIIEEVVGNKIIINIPVVDPIEEQYGGAMVYRSSIRGRISQCGVENLRIESSFEHNEDEDHGWNAVVLARAKNCWVKNVVAKYFGYACVNIQSMSVFNTVQDCAMVDPKSVTTGGRKYSFNISHGSMGNLIQRCVAWGGRHDFVTGSRVPGPNVFLDCVAENSFADIGPHHRWSTGVLFDNIYGGQIRVQDRKAMGSGHGWAGAQTLFWNCRSVKKDIKVESPLGAMNWGIGCVGIEQKGDGYWESWGMHVNPRSLYLKQLEEREGRQAVFNVTTSAQRDGAIWDSLKERATEIVNESRAFAP